MPKVAEVCIQQDAVFAFDFDKGMTAMCVTCLERGYSRLASHRTGTNVKCL